MTPRFDSCSLVVVGAGGDLGEMDNWNCQFRTVLGKGRLVQYDFASPHSVKITDSEKGRITMARQGIPAAGRFKADQTVLPCTVPFPLRLKSTSAL